MISRDGLGAHVLVKLVRYQVLGKQRGVYITKATRAISLIDGRVFSSGVFDLTLDMHRIR